MAERDASGKFIKGHEPYKQSPGRPKRKTEEKYLRAFRRTVKAKDLREILRVVMARARSGDASAARLILEYAMGKPAQSVDVTSGGDRLPNVIVYLPEIDGLETELGTTGEVSS